MGGQIQVESNVGRGSLFHCRLPIVVIDNDLEVINEFPRLDMHQQDSRPIRRISEIDRFAGLVLLPHELIQDLRQAALRCDPERLRRFCFRWQPRIPRSRRHCGKNLTISHSIVFSIRSTSIARSARYHHESTRKPG